MNIDWFTVIAQIINFIILVWLLKKTLYKPVFNAINERNKQIEMQLQSAKYKLTDAENTKAEYLNKNNQWEQEREKLYANVKSELDQYRQNVIVQTKTEVKEWKEKLMNEWREDQMKLRKLVADNIKKEVIQISGKVLSDLASANLEEQIIHTFISKMTMMSVKEKEEMVAALKTSKDNILVRSAFPIAKSARDAIDSKMKELVPECSPRYEENPPLIAGIELLCNGYRISWSIEDYLASFNKMEELSPISNSR